jgi:hypothetical protein
MKTLREYIEILDEISRRDFLKGAGATAGLAAVGAPKDASAQSTEQDFWNKLFAICALHIACKGPYQNAEATNGQTVVIPPDVCQQTKQLIQKFIKGYPNGKNIIQGAYNNMYDSINQAESAKPFRGSVLNRAYFDKAWQQKVLKDFESLVEFLSGSGTPPTSQQLASVRTNMTSEEEVDEAAAPDAVRRIEQLVQYK